MEELVFRLHGEGINPETLRSRDLGDLLIKFEDSIRTLIREQNEDIGDDEIFLSVVDIESDSVGIKYKPNLKEVVAAFVLIASSFNSNNFDILPTKTIIDLKEIQSRTRKYNCSAEFKVNGEVLGELRPDTEISISENLKVRGETSIYGKLVRVGGVEPKARLELLDGYAFSVDISESLAQEIAKDLYKTINLNGNAVWNTKDSQIIQFRAESRGQYTETSNRQSFSELSDLLGEYWNPIDNIDEVLNE